MNSAKRAMLALLAVGLVIGICAVARAATASLLCGANEHRFLTGQDGRSYLLRNPYWRGTGEACIRSTGHGNFKVVRTPKPDGHVTSYPDVMRGCIWQVCTERTAMPAQIRDIRWLHSTWHTRENARGTWNAAYDIWIGRHKHNRDGSATRDGAELMIWLNHHGACCALRYAHKFRIERRWWWLQTWRACDSKINICWHYIQFRLVHPRWRVDNLDLKPFVRLSERKHLIQPRWWMQSVGAGFEVWSGGVGLTSTKYRVTMSTARR